MSRKIAEEMTSLHQTPSEKKALTPQFAPRCGDKIQVCTEIIAMATSDLFVEFAQSAMPITFISIPYP